MSKRSKELERLAKAKENGVDNKLFNAYKDALKKLKKEVKAYTEEYEKLTVSQQLSLKRKRSTAKKIENIIEAASKESEGSVASYLKDTAADSYYGTLYDLEGKTKMAMDFNMLDEKYIETLVNKKTSGKNFFNRLYGHNDKLINAVESELLDGAIEGKGYARIAKAISEQTESTYKAALRIARTESGRITTESTQRGYEEAQSLGINMKKQWVASLDEATRDNHADLDGQTVGIDEMFEMDGMFAEGPGDFGDAAMDINCRCTTITIVDGIAPSLRRDNISKKVIPNQTYNEWRKDKGI